MYMYVCVYGVSDGHWVHNTGYTTCSVQQTYSTVDNVIVVPKIYFISFIFIRDSDVKSAKNVTKRQNFRSNNFEVEKFD